MTCFNVVLYDTAIIHGLDLLLAFIVSTIR